MTCIQPLCPSLMPTPLFGAPGQVLLDPNHEFNASVLQDGLRASWWAPAFNDGDAATGLSDVADAIEAPYVAPSPQFDLNANGTPVVRIPTAKWDRCVQLNGSTDYFSVADHADLRIAAGQTVTFVAWIWVQTPLANSITPVFSKSNGTTVEYMLYIGTTPDIFFHVTTPDGNRYQAGIGGLPLQQWVMVRCYFDATTLKAGIALGGGAVVEGGLVGTYGAPTFTAPFEIGAASASSVYFNGFLDEVTRWNRHLTANEIEWLLQNDLWNGAIALFKAASGNPIEYPYGEAVADPDLPAAPSGLSLELDGNEVDLAWCINAIGPGNWHEIYRSVDGGDFARLAVTSPRVSTFHDSTADTSAHVYDYKVRARNKFGRSDYSLAANSEGEHLILDDGGDFSLDDGGKLIL